MTSNITPLPQGFKKAFHKNTVFEIPLKISFHNIANSLVLLKKGASFGKRQLFADQNKMLRNSYDMIHFGYFKRCVISHSISIQIEMSG